MRLAATVFMVVVLSAGCARLEHLQSGAAVDAEGAATPAMDLALVLSLGPIAREWLSVWGALLLVGVVLLGIIVPLVLHVRVVVVLSAQGIRA